MEDWNCIRKLEALAPFEAGISKVHRIIGKSSGAGLAVGFSDFEPGTIDMDVESPEMLIILAGSLEVTFGGNLIKLAPDEALWMPAGASLQIQVSAPSRVLYIIDESA